MERAHNRLQSELERSKDSNRTQEDQKESRLHVDQLQEQTDQLTAKLSSLQTTHNTLRFPLVHSYRHKKLLTHVLAIELPTWLFNLVSWLLTKYHWTLTVTCHISQGWNGVRAAAAPSQAEHQCPGEAGSWGGPRQNEAWDTASQQAAQVASRAALLYKGSTQQQTEAWTASSSHRIQAESCREHQGWKFRSGNWTSCKRNWISRKAYAK